MRGSRRRKSWMIASVSRASQVELKSLSFDSAGSSLQPAPRGSVRMTVYQFGNPAALALRILADEGGTRSAWKDDDDGTVLSASPKPIRKLDHRSLRVVVVSGNRNAVNIIAETPS